MSKIFSFLSCVTDLGANIRGASNGGIEISKMLINKNTDGVIKLFQNFYSDETQADKNIKEIVSKCSKQYLDSLNNNYFPILLGGDHSCSMSSIMASSQYAKQHNRPFYVMWFDAHADFNTLEQSKTGNIHGMPVAMLTNIDKSSLIIPNEEFLIPKNFNLYGARSIDEAEVENLKQYGINWVDDNYHHCLMNIKSLLNFIEPNAFIHVSFDTDCLNPITAPGVSTPVNGGFSIDQALNLLQTVFEDKRFSSLDIVEYNPLFDQNKNTLKQIESIFDLLFSYIH